MKTYLTYAPIAILVVFIYLVYGWYKNQKEFQKESGINPFSPVQTFKFFFNSSKTEEQSAAYKKLKQRSIKSFKIWALTLLIFILVTIVVGVLTAKNK